MKKERKEKKRQEKQEKTRQEKVGGSKERKREKNVVQLVLIADPRN